MVLFSLFFKTYCIYNVQSKVQRSDICVSNCFYRMEGLLHDAQHDLLAIAVFVQEMAEAHISLAIRLAHLLHEVWSNIKTWQHEQKRSIARLCIPTPDVLDVLNTL